MGLLPSNGYQRLMKHWSVCYAASVVLVVVILFATNRIHGIELLLLPGMLLSLLISKSSDKSDFSFIAGMAVNTICYAWVISTIARHIHRSSKQP